jgi:hypothetical protein
MATLTRQIHFASAHLAMRVLRKKAVEQFINGDKVVTEPEVVYEFTAGNLFLEPGQDVMCDKVVPGEGVFDQDAAEYLRNHPDYGIRFKEIVPVAPDPGPLYAEIADALIAGDVDKLTAIGDDEYAEWNREEVMERVRGALSRLQPKE